MITIVMSAAIAAEPQRVWRALTDPSECIAWDEKRLSVLDSTDAYPDPGETVRWHYRMGSVPIVMREQPIEVVAGRKLHSKVTLGSLHFDQIFTLNLEHDPASPDDTAKTLLGMKVVASNSAPVLGAVIDRFEVRRLTIDRVDATLRAITKWCESGA
ncbi:MAG: SRPBCC family protein [Deltaproteobacteria bacterium]|nr:SRPBCC family protein [Deltaproteobacteria bacterium]